MEQSVRDARRRTLSAKELELRLCFAGGASNDRARSPFLACRLRSNWLVNRELQGREWTKLERLYIHLGPTNELPGRGFVTGICPEGVCQMDSLCVAVHKPSCASIAMHTLQTPNPGVYSVLQFQPTLSLKQAV